ncbi:hypothetical protein A4H97_18360 [Niastella yeongjuensis]|uniref:DUF4595 domain-containing protein n=1 Tax=Niastella yeongjuensis TaxID=354355 RepID=A0A1V9DXU9_9BACT|nr:hypothetical protein [Niastella yeongjuensis]OQP38682.1 hypothetical protein A4H97_18360 [Niastella yeongjuensis]SEO36585.1 hypothetical protein SAMN05660816_02730 [Niastella yeongjuensis]
MKLTLIYCYIFLLIIAASACKKDSAGDNASLRIISYTEDITAIGGRTVETYSVEYDAQNRITSVASTNKHGARTVYQYSAENSFTCDKYTDAVLLYHSVYFINNQSLIDSTWGREYKEAPYKSDTISGKFYYNEDKKLIKQKEFLNSTLVPPVLNRTINYQYDINGTLVKETADDYESSYAYEKENKNTVQLQPFYFPSNDQLPSHSYITRFGTTLETKHTYTFDDHKRVIGERAEQSDGRITILSYTYEK